VQFILKNLNLKPSAKLLDVGCGFGRHSMELVLKGMNPVGVDFSKVLVDAARKTCQLMGLPGEFFYGDIRNFQYPQKFDGAIIMLNAFGLMSDEHNEEWIGNKKKYSGTSPETLIPKPTAPD